MNQHTASISKITAPTLPKIILRSRLFRYLDETESHTVTWLSAMAGSGKTTYTLSYLTHNHYAYVWYRLDEGDSDPAYFFQNLSRAAGSHFDNGERSLPMFTPENTPGGEAFAQVYFEKLSAELRKPIWVVFDDYQEIERQSPLHTLLKKGFAAVQPQVRILVISRSDPPPEMAVLKAKRRLSVIHAEELRFNRSETKQFVTLLSGRVMDEQTLGALHTRTQGWAAGIVLLAGDRHPVTAASFEQTSALPTGLFNYFAVELFNRQPADIQQFFLKTAHLPQMSAKDAALLTQNANAERILEALNRKHLFIERTDAPEPDYRYHMLWRQFLIDQNPAYFSAAEVDGLRNTAAGILAGRGHLEEAAGLLVRAGDRDKLTTFILRHAGILISRGCHSTLADWLNGLPAASVRRQPWLCYWSGICLQFTQPPEAQKKLGRALFLFKKTGDANGCLLAWSGIVDSIVYEWHFFARLDRWLRWYDCNFKDQAHHFSDSGVKTRVTVSLAVAMLIRRPQDSKLLTIVDEAIGLARQSGEIDLILRATVWTITYFAWMGNFGRAGVSLNEFKQLAADHADRLPSLTLHWQWLDLSIRTATMNRLETAPREIRAALASAGRSGLYFTAQTLVFLEAYVAMTMGDKIRAQQSIGTLEALLDESHYHGHSVYHHFSGWYQLQWGDAHKALAHARKATEVSDKTGYVLASLVCRIQLAFCLFENNEKEQAWREITRVGRWSRKTGSAIYRFMVLLIKGYFAARVQSPRALRYLREGLTIGQRNNYVNMIWWGVPRLWRWVAATAMQHHIETAYVKELIFLHRIAPPEGVNDTNQWPWPFRVRTLGEFKIEKHGHALTFNGKTPQKPLALLKHVITRTPSPDAVETIIDDLWPNADGNSGSSALSTTLNRLRRLVGDPEAVRLNNGQLSLLAGDWWIDAIAFENDCTIAARYHQAKDLNRALTHYRKALSLYRGEFMAGEKYEQAWLTTKREHLKKTFVRLLINFGQCLEAFKKYNQALSVYQKGLAVDPFEETFYQRMMRCCFHLGRYAKAVGHYQTCCQILENDLGVPPSEETQRLYQNVRKAAAGQILA